MAAVQGRCAGITQGVCQSTMVYRFEGPYSYERKDKRLIGDRDIDEWVAHAL